MTASHAMNLYRYIPIWSRTADGLALYRCFEVIGAGFTVQSRDFLRPPFDEVRSAQLASQFLELLQEAAPELRFPCQPTVEAAIAAFEATFET